LERWLAFLLEAMAEKGPGTVELPIEQAGLMERVVTALETWCDSDDPDRDFCFWDTVATARETYRERIRLGFDGQREELPFDELGPVLVAFQAKVRAGIQRAVEMNQGASPGIPPTYFAYTVTGYDLLTGAEGEPRRDEQNRPYVQVKHFEPRVLPLFLEGPMHALKVQPEAASARDLYAKIRESDLYDRELGMYKVNASLDGQPHEIGRARAFTPGWLENESIWLHMEYKYLLEVLKAGLYEEFFADLKRALVCFQDPAVYGRSPLENSSFLVSSAHPDESLHGAGFVARLSGATAEFLSIWTTMMAGRRPFSLQDGKLCLAFQPTLPGWLFDGQGKLSFTFLGQVHVTYHNPNRRDLFPDDGLGIRRLILRLQNGRQVELGQSVVGEPYAQMIRSGQIKDIDVYFQAGSEFDR
jgi:hypothetical protein